jgi:hypothetical protein
MAGRFSLIAVFIYGFQLCLALLVSYNFLGIGNIPTDTTNVNVNVLAQAVNVQSCNTFGIAIPFSCSTIVLIGGALVSSVLFFGAWAFGLTVWLGFFGAALLDINYTLVNLLGLPLRGAAIIDLFCLAAFVTDMVYMYSWRDMSAG